MVYCSTRDSVLLLGWHFAGSILNAKRRVLAGSTHQTSPPLAKRPITALPPESFRTTQLQRTNSKSLRQPLRVKPKASGTGRSTSLSASAILGLQRKRSTPLGLQDKFAATGETLGPQKKQALGLQGKQSGGRTALSLAALDLQGKRGDVPGLQKKRGAAGTAERTALVGIQGKRGAGEASSLQGTALSGAETGKGTAATVSVQGKQGAGEASRLQRKHGTTLGLQGGAGAVERESVRICPVRHKANFVCKLCMGK